MKRSFTVLCTSLALFTAAHAADDNWSLNNHFEVYGDFLYMTRQSLGNQTVVKGSNSLKTKNKATALALTQREMISKDFANKGNSNYAHPYHWASFVLVGDWE